MAGELYAIDDRFVDVDFTKDPRYVFGDLGGQLYATRRTFEERFGTLSDAEIDAEIEAIEAAGGGLERLVTRIYNQGQEGSCVANAACQGMELIQAKTFGKENVIPLSAMSLYKRIGRSAQSGAIVSDGLDELQERGVLPLDTPENKAKFPHTHPATGFSRSLPSGWEETGKLFLAIEALPIQSILGIYTALAMQFPVMVGREGHSICYTTPTKRSGKRGVVYANSWDYDWGFAAGDMQGGFGFDTEQQVRKSASWAYAIRTIRTDWRVAA